MPKALSPPPFEIPFDDEQLILMGKIAVLWGHIDEAFNTSLRWALRLDQELFEKLLDGRTMASKVPMFRLAGSELPSAHARSLFEMVANQLTAIIPDHDAAMHHCWGRFGLPTDVKTRVGTHSHQRPGKRFYLEQLPRLYSDMAAAMQFLANIRFFMIDGKPEFTTFRQSKILFAPSPQNAPSNARPFQRGDTVFRVEFPSAVRKQNTGEKPVRNRGEGCRQITH